MADASRIPFSGLPAAPQTWGEAFAALPADTPDASRWPALAQAAARRAAQARRRRIGLALAAGLCALALLPFALQHGAHRAMPHAPTRSVAATAPVPVTARVATASPTAPARETPTTAMPARADGTMPRIAGTASTEPRRATPRARASAHDAHRTTTRIAHAKRRSAPAARGETLDTLYATSARLEALLAVARDTRVDSGPAAVLAGGYDAELATIDAQLAQPRLSRDAQRRLWRARVDLLRQAAALESQFRVLAASGSAFDGRLVSVD